MNDRNTVKAASQEGMGYVRATLKYEDEVEPWWSTDPVALDLFDTCGHYALICASVVARSAASVRIRWYTTEKAGGGSKSKAIRRGASFLAAKQCSVSRMAERADAYVEVLEHPVIDLLDRPNPFNRSGSRFIQQTILHWMVCGKAYWLIERAGDEPTAIYQLHPQHTSVIPSTTQFIEGYRYGRQPGREVTYGPDDVIFLKYQEHPTDPFDAIGPLDMVTSDVELLAAAVTSETHRWMRDARPDLHLETPRDTTDAEMALIERNMRRYVSGGHRERNYTIGPVKPTVIGLPPKDMEYTNGQRISMQRIRNAFGVPESLLELNSANLASAKVGYADYIRVTIAPIMVELCSCINEHLASIYEPDGDLWCAPDLSMLDDEEAEQRILSARIANGVTTVNEARAELGLEPLAPPAPPREPDPPPPEPGEPRKSIASSRIVRVLKSSPRVPDGDSMAEAILAWMRRVLGRGINPQGGLDVTPEDREALASEVESGIEDPYSIGWDQAGGEARGRASVEAFSASNLAAMGDLASHRLLVAGSIISQVEERLREVLAAKLAEGASIPQIASALAADPEAWFDATRLARTEASNAYNAGRISAFRASGAVRRLEWILSPDPCPVCVELAEHFNANPIAPGAVAIPRGGKLTLKDGRVITFSHHDVKGPPGHPNCICTVGAVFKGE